MASTTTATNTITISLQNQTGLDENKFSIYVLGFSTASQKMLSVGSGTTATFVTVPSASGTLPAYKLGAEISQISIDLTPPLSQINGARIYFFVADNSKFPTAPAISYSNSGANVANVKNPPNPDVPPYSFSEFTVVDLSYGAVIDLQTVDGLTFPLNLTLNDSLGAVGQPLSAGSGFNRGAILAAYKTFMDKIGSASAPFLDLQYSENSGGLLNPGLYLTETDQTNQLLNLKSPLNNLFDADLKTLFSNSKLSIQGVAAGTSIAADVYTVKSTGEQPLPTANGLSHPALQFKGKTNGIELNVFSPLGLCTLTFDDNGTTTAISGQLDDTTLTFDTALPPDTNIVVGMYVSGAGVDPNTTTVKSVTLDGSNNITGVVISGTETGKPAHSQYGFSKIPAMFMTSGAMVFANAGVFAYSGSYSVDEATVVLNLQNQLVSALNRGVANTAPTTGADGYSSQYWGTQANWYPANATQNLFSLFMHTAAVETIVYKIENEIVNEIVGEVPIFIQAAGSTACARGTKMGQAYGFAYDENAGPVPPAPQGQPEVPSKFDPLPSGANTLTITLGAWS
jgi:hypothetical protein